MAVGAVAAFRDHGLAVHGTSRSPAFDDIETLRDLVPSLTTVHLDLQHVGARSAALSLDSAPDDGVRLVRVKAPSSFATAPAGSPEVVQLLTICNDRITVLIAWFVPL